MSSPWILRVEKPPIPFSTSLDSIGPTGVLVLQCVIVSLNQVGFRLIDERAHFSVSKELLVLSLGSPGRVRTRYREVSANTVPYPGRHVLLI